MQLGRCITVTWGKISRDKAFTVHQGLPLIPKTLDDPLDTQSLGLCLAMKKDKPFSVLWPCKQLDMIRTRSILVLPEQLTGSGLGLGFEPSDFSA